MQRFVVVGGGLAGLTAANALAGPGRSVVVLEQSEALGGRARTQVSKGYRLNLGPHALYLGGAAARTLREWGIPFTGKAPDVNSGAFMVHDGRPYPLIVGAQGLITTRLFGTAEKWQATRILQQMVSGSAAGGESMAEWIAQRARSERVRQFAAMLVRVSTYTADLARLSARAALDQFRLAKSHGVLYLDCGWQTLVDGLEQRARRLGVEIRTGEIVRSLEQIDADGIVLAVSPDAVERIADRTLPPMHRVCAAILDLDLRKLPEGSARVAFGVDRPLYFSVHSASAKLAPEGGAVVHVARYLHDDPADREELEEFADRMMPGWREHVESSRFLPRMTVTPASFSAEGRPAVDELGIAGVALAGDWVGSEGMLADAAVSSGLRAAGVVQRQKLQAA